MSWYAVYHTDTGRLVSVGTLVTAPLPDGLTAATLADRPDFSAVQWDQAQRAFVPRPAPPPLVDRLTDLITRDEYAELRDRWASLNTATKNAIRNAVITLLGPFRYRREEDGVTLG